MGVSGAMFAQSDKPWRPTFLASDIMSLLKLIFHSSCQSLLAE
jgi:hypothetical protein